MFCFSVITHLKVIFDQALTETFMSSKITSEV